MSKPASTSALDELIAAAEAADNAVRELRQRANETDDRSEFTARLLQELGRRAWDAHQRVRMARGAPLHIYPPLD